MGEETRLSPSAMMMGEKRTGDWSLYSGSMVSRLHSISTQDKQTKIREGFQCMNGRICMTVLSLHPTL